MASSKLPPEVVGDDLAGGVGAVFGEGAHAGVGGVGGFGVGLVGGHGVVGQGRRPSGIGDRGLDRAPGRRHERAGQRTPRPSPRSRPGMPDQRRSGPCGHQEVLGRVERGRVGGVGARGRPTRGGATSSPAAAASRRSSRGVKHVVHRSTSASSPCLVLHHGALVVHARDGVEGVLVLEEAHLEVGGEGGHGEDDRPVAAPGPCRPARHRRRRAARRGHR